MAIERYLINPGIGSVDSKGATTFARILGSTGVLAEFIVAPLKELRMSNGLSY
jgi:hypothetical protein